MARDRELGHGRRSLGRQAGMVNFKPTDEQGGRWLPRFAGHEFTVGTAAFVEPRWDFDATSLATRAERQGGDYVLTGEKCLVPLAARAEVILVYAAAPEGLAAFIVELGT